MIAGIPTVSTWTLLLEKKRNKTLRNIALCVCGRGGYNPVKFAPKIVTIER